jgi:hypothetical protein
VCAVTDPTEELDADKASRFARMLWYPHEPEYHAAICVRRELARLRAPAAGAPSEAVARLRELLDSYFEELCGDEEHCSNEPTYGFAAVALDTLERELAEKTALAELVPLLDQRLKDCAVTIKGQDRKLRDLEARLAANPALELPTRDELARFLSQATEGDAWDTEPDDEYGKVFRNAWRKKANRILAFLAPKPPEGA